MELGYALSSEEHGPRRLVELAARAEDAGFPFALISDHFHPWTDRQGNAPFVWSVLGAIAGATRNLRVGTGVTCPLIRTHPAVIAHASATVAAMMPGRFFLGVGTGENLNEHVTGERWPAPDERVEMMEEAIELIRDLWSGEMITRRGRFYSVDHARLYSLPETRPPLYVAAKKPHAAHVAGRLGDGLIDTSPSAEVVTAFHEAANDGGLKPAIAEMTVCVAPTEAEGRRVAREWWPNAAVGGGLGQELPLPEHFEAAAELVTDEVIGRSVVCGSDVEAHLEAIDAYVQAGFTAVYLHQVGPDQDSFFAFYRDRVMPEVARRYGTRRVPAGALAG